MLILVERPLQKAEALFVRGLGQARTGKLDAADTSLRDMRAIVEQIAAAKDLDVDVRARILDVQAKQLDATLLLARKQNDAALKALEETIRIEDAPGVSWAPPDAGTGLPAHEFLGEALLQLGRRAEAAREFEAALKKRRAACARSRDSRGRRPRLRAAVNAFDGTGREACRLLDVIAGQERDTMAASVGWFQTVNASQVETRTSFPRTFVKAPHEGSGGYPP